MGIPSYYKRLVDTVEGLVCKTHPGAIDWLWMDFNCLIYHCLRHPDTPVYPGEEGRIEWEKTFVKAVSTYMLHIVREVKPKKGVYIAIDGVVPMAKMRQQRLRRFKSAWLTQNGVADTWDTNAITPGTDFMKRLRVHLETICVQKTTTKMRYILSSSDEPGEGEHKLMEQWRSTEHSATKDTYAVYGLDADLIVLSLLNRGARNVWLFREEIEFGTVMRDAVGDECYCWLSMPILSEYIQSQIGERTIQEYCFAMSVLGNDFLPSSLSFKMREDGHDALLECLCSLKGKDSALLGDEGEIQWNGVQQLMEWLARDEAARVQRFVVKKMAMARNYDSVSIGDNNWPLVQRAEEVLMKGSVIRDNWRELYYKEWLGGEEVKGQLCEEYLYGIQWIWAYYTGKMDQVCFNWFYPGGLSPLWVDILNLTRRLNSLHSSLRTRTGECLVRKAVDDDVLNLTRHPRTPTIKCFPGEIKVRREDIQPVEQLCLVLPVDSWGLIPYGSRQRQLIEKAPWLFPSSFGFGSVGKRYFWECEAEIPVPSIAEVKAILG